MPTLQTLRKDLSQARGQEALVQVLGLLCRLTDDDRLELQGCDDPDAICRLVEYAGCRHGGAERGDGGWRLLLWRGPRGLTD